MTNQISPCLWFNNHAKEAARLYIFVFKNFKIKAISYYGKEGFEFHGQPEGTVLNVAFRINGQLFTALNGTPVFKFNEAISFQVFCDTQDEIDHYWEKLTEEVQEGQCGWLKDKFGVLWQIVPSILPKLMANPAKAGKVINACMQMKKFEIAKLIDI